MTGHYQRQYVDFRFERSGLFKLIQEKYHPKEVLYPGCSVHITPAFFFPHVVFVDHDPATMAFFSNQAIVLDLIKRHRRYRRTPYIQYIYQDFTKPLPVPEDQFDLILALYTGGVSKSCLSYLKKNGLLLTNNHQNDAVDASHYNELTLIAIAQKHQNRYRLIEKDIGEPLKIRHPAHKTKPYLRQTSSGVEYIENEKYFIFRRT
jgi:hypothetical protein